jgi:ABC-type transport system involved in cytochrome bd biosynthesis fused ATPase/permease subunit
LVLIGFGPINTLFHDTTSRTKIFHPYIYGILINSYIFVSDKSYLYILVELAAMKDIHALQVEITKANIRALQEELKKRPSIFSDKRHLESLGFPFAISGREAEKRQILNFLSSSGYIPPLISIYGRSGTGKSTIMKIISEQFLCQDFNMH